MGASTAWLAFQGIGRATVLERLNLQPATESDPDIFGAELPNDWYLVLGRGLGFMDDAIMNRAYADCLGVSCYLETHVMVSAAAGWQNGRRIWSVLHDTDEKLEHLEIKGKPPTRFVAIRDSLMAKQKTQRNPPRVDYIFDIPIELAAAITGFHYDRGTSAGYPDLDGLEIAVVPTLPPESWLQDRREGWFTRYFG